MSCSSWWEVRLESPRLLPLLSIHLGPAPSRPPGPRTVASSLLPGCWPRPHGLSSLQQPREGACESLPLLGSPGLPCLAGESPGPPRSPQPAARKTLPAPPRLAPSAPRAPRPPRPPLSPSLCFSRWAPSSLPGPGTVLLQGTGMRRCRRLGHPPSVCPHGWVLLSHVSAPRHCLGDALLTVPAEAASSRPDRRPFPRPASFCPPGSGTLACSERSSCSRSSPPSPSIFQQLQQGGERRPSVLCWVRSVWNRAAHAAATEGCWMNK